jgi:AI-2 transport protein TqsA
VSPAGVSQKTVDAVLSSLLTTLASVLSNGFLVLVYTMFLIAGRTWKKDAAAVGVWAAIEARIKRYIILKVGLCAVTGTIVGAVLGILGVKLAFAFGFFAFILNFIPSIGSIVATALPLPMVLVDPALSPAVRVLAIAIPGAVQFVVGNVIEPKLLGESLDLHPIAILSGLIFFGMVWGIVGMFVAAPILAVAKILCERGALTRPIAELLAGRPPGTASMGGT